MSMDMPQGKRAETVPVIRRNSRAILFLLMLSAATGAASLIFGRYGIPLEQIVQIVAGKLTGQAVAFGFPRLNESNKLDELGIANVPGAVTANLESSLKQLEVYAEALGAEAPSRAKQYTDFFRAKLNAVRAVTDKLTEEQRPSVYYSAIDLLSTYGKYSDLTEVIRAAGGRSVTAELDAGNHSQITFEQLVQYNPAYIFIDQGGLDELDTVEKLRENAYSDGRYGIIKAIADRQVYLTPSGVFYWDMGLQKILLVLEMAKILHPDLFEELDMNAELREFYTKFDQYELTLEEADQILNRENP